MPERIKIEKFFEKNLKDEYVILIRNLKQALNHELVLKKVHRVIKFNQKGWLKSDIDMNTALYTEISNLLQLKQGGII